MACGDYAFLLNPFISLLFFLCSLIFCNWFQFIHFIVGNIVFFPSLNVDICCSLIFNIFVPSGCIDGEFVNYLPISHLR